jgi:uncharacterized protein
MSRGTRLAAAGVLAAFVIALVGLSGCTKVVTAPAGSAANTVTALGTGTVQATPDTGEMSFGVSTTSSNAKSALDNASKVAGQIATAIKKAGVADKDIQARDVNVYPQMDSKNAITGYQSTLTVRAKVRDLSKLGDVISAANGAGANSIDGPTFTVAEPAPFRAQAIAKAVADARASAEAMAQAAGKSVGAVLCVSSTDAGTTPPGPLYDSAMSAAKSVPIQTGQLDITSNVTVIFELK